MSIIRMDSKAYDEIVKYAKEHLPEESCGLIAGKIDGNDKVIKKVYFLENIDHAEDHFSMNPKEQLAAIKDMRENGYQALGNWHSHPSSPSRPSVEDIRLAYDKNASYMILSFLTEAPIINSFHIENGKYEKEDLRIFNEEYYF
ncbi:MAG: M67 family metallopeptidase [Lachnospiraceae bacterium]